MTIALDLSDGTRALSITRHYTPCRASSAAIARPVGPAPTTRTEWSMEILPYSTTSARYATAYLSRQFAKCPHQVSALYGDQADACGRHGKNAGDGGCEGSRICGRKT